MFEELRLDHIHSENDYVHLDIEVKWLRGIKLYPKVRFKFFRTNNEVGLEFRRLSDWPTVFEPWPGKSSDQFGPYFIVSNLDLSGESIGCLNAPGLELIADLASNLNLILEPVSLQCEFRSVDRNTLIAEAVKLQKYLLDFVGKIISQEKALENKPLPLKETANMVPEKVVSAREVSVVPPALVNTVPDYVSVMKDEFNSVVLTPLSVKSNPLPSYWSPIVISVVRDEIDRLHDFLRHYREAGVERFVFIDNGSSDGTVDYLSVQHDVDLYAKHGKFEWKLKQGWINKVVQMYGYNRWYAYFDADEHAVFDGFGTRTLGDLAQLMEASGITRIRGLLIDMYADCALLDSSYVSHTRLDHAYPLFDSASYKQERYREIISVKGGPRPRAFGKADAKFRPELTKYPIFKLKEGQYMANPHHIWPYEGNFDSDRYIGILHYKFLPGVVKKIRRAIQEESYWGGSIEYKCYMSVLEKEPQLSLVCSESRRYTAPSDLINFDIIATIPWTQQISSHRMRAVYLRRRAELRCSDGMAAFMAVYPTAQRVGTI